MIRESLLALLFYSALAIPVPCQNLAGSNVLVTPRSAAAGDTGRLLLYELGANGENMVGLKAPDALAADTVYVMPVAFPAASGSLLSSTTLGVLSWVSAGTAALGSCTTAGSICFSDGTTLQQDNANLFWDNALKRMGLGTNAPSTLADMRAATGTNLQYSILPAGWTTRHRFGVPYSGGTPVLAANASLTAASAGNLDDTANPAMALILSGESPSFNFVKASAGVNPRTFSSVLSGDSAGKIGIGTAAPGNQVEISSYAAGATLNYSIAPSGVTPKLRFGAPYSGTVAVLSANGALTGPGAGNLDDTGTGSAALILESSGAARLVTASPGVNPVAYLLGIYMNAAGKVGIGGAPTITATGTFHAGGDHGRPFDVAHTPVTSAEACNAGELSFDGTFLYICVAPSTWRRIPSNAF